jgi:hypothetical protein
METVRAWSLRRIAEQRRQIQWPKSGPWTEWQVKSRLSIENWLGLPYESTDLDTEYGPVEEFKSHCRQFVQFTSRPGLRVCGWWLIPKRLRTDWCCLCFPGHGPGMDPIVGIGDEDYQHRFALQCVQNGFPTLAIEPISFGHRRSKDPWSCDSDQLLAISLGESLMAWRIWDAMTSVRWIRSRPECIDTKLAVFGISGGGLIALWSAALDLRIDLVAVSGYYCRFQDSIYSCPHCIDNVHFGMATRVEVEDLAALIPPRTLLTESGIDDPIFPRSGVELAAKHAHHRFQKMGGHYDHTFLNFGHEFDGKLFFNFLIDNSQKKRS